MKNLLRWNKALQDGLRLKDPHITDIKVTDAPSSPHPSVPGAPETDAADQSTSGENTAAGLSVWSWENAPVHQGRDFAVVDVSKSDAKRKAKHEAPSMLKNVVVWTIFVQDKSRPDSPTFEVYGKDGKNQNRKDSKTTGLSVPAGAVDLSICANEDDARGLGAYVCTLMNRVPFDLFVASWVSGAHTARTDGEPGLDLVRRLVQARALDLWQPPFDRLRLHEDHQDLKLGLASNQRLDTFDDQRVSLGIRCLFTSIEHNLRYSYIRVQILYSKLDVRKINALPDVPADFMYKFAPVGGATTDKQRVLLKAFHIIQYTLSFKVGSKKETTQYLDQELAKINREQHVVAPKVSKDNTSGKTAKTPKDKTSGKTAQTPKAKVNIWNVMRNNLSVSFRPTVLAVGLCAGKIPLVTIRSASGTMVAHVLNRMLTMQIRKRDVLNIWQTGMVEADLISNSRITQDDVKQGYCSCKDVSEQGRMKHICMICLESFLCSDMLSTPDRRRVCQSHADNAFEMHNDQMTTKTLTRRLTTLISSSRFRARRDVSPDRIPSAKAFKQKLLPSILTPNTWLDWYFGERSTYDVSFGAGSDGINPAQMSLDAIHNIFIIDGWIVQHHPENSALTALCFNYLKGQWGASILPVMGAAATQTLKESNGAVRDEALWADIHNAADRIHRLCLQVTCLASARKKLTPDQIDEELMGVHLDSLRSSLWHPGQSSPVPKYKRQLPTSLGEGKLDPRALAQAIPMLISPWKRSIFASKASLPVYPPWTNDDKKRLTDVIKEMQADPLINPKGLKIPWSATGAPWVFRKDHMFTEDVDLWDWLFEEVHARLCKMYLLCNIQHDTVDSPDTILLEIVVQWLRNGGTYDYIHCEMTIFLSHPLCLSLGRSAKVEPGSPMMTGWTDSRPSSLHRHYDMNRSTITVQPQCINKFWMNFKPKFHPLMFQMLCDLPKRTAYYGTLVRCTPKVEYRKETRVSKKRRGSLVEDEHIENEHIEDLADEDLRADLRAQGLIDDEEQSDEESDADGLDDATGHEVEVLQGTLEILVDEIANCDPDFLDTQQCQEGLRNLRRIAKSGEEYLFWELHGDFVDVVQSRIDGTSAEKTDKCCECSQNAIAGMMLLCANPAHIDAIFHFTCVEGLSAMPAGDSMMLCPTCERERSREDSDTPASRHRNMINLGATCYMSSSVQILHHLVPILNIPFNSESLLAKPDAQSGRTPRQWLPGQYKFKPETSDAKISEMSSQHMGNAKAMCEAFIALSDHLRTPGMPSHSQTSQFFKCVNAINPSDWKKDEMNDSVALFNTLVECMLLTTEDSEPSERGRLGKLSSVQHQADQPMPLLVDDSSSHYTAYVGEGRTSLLTGNVCVQFVKEYDCDCGAISRSFEHAPVLDLDLPPEGSDSDEFGLIKMLEGFVSDQTDIASGTTRVCSACERPAVRMLYRKITISPNVLVISFKRLAGARLEHVDLPEYLDLSPYADGARLQIRTQATSSFSNSQSIA